MAAVEIKATKTRAGFTIIELMIVVAIVSILAVIAVPAYLNYVARSKVTEGLGFLAEAKSTITERYYSGNQEMPTNNVDAGLSDPNDYGNHQYIRSLIVTSAPSPGTLNVTFKIPGSTADGKRLLLIPTLRSGKLTWLCEPASGPDGISRSQVPPVCRG